ncbi:hypothetical protein HY950_02560 [Candidatus Gottesmanbacteria bacterium]|nr:hypothetical protein [Candidatus Gottesmanbacteria bacterium]
MMTDIIKPDETHKHLIYTDWKVIPQAKIDSLIEALDQNTRKLLTDGWHLYPLILEVTTPNATNPDEAAALVEPLCRALIEAYDISDDLNTQVQFGALATTDGHLVRIPFFTPASHQIGKEDGAQQAVFNLTHWATSRLTAMNSNIIFGSLPVSAIDTLRKMS